MRYVLEKRPQKMGGGAKMYYTEITRPEDLEVLMVQLERYSDVRWNLNKNVTPTQIFTDGDYIEIDLDGISSWEYCPEKSCRLSATQFLSKAKEMFPKTEPAEKFNFFKLGKFEFELITNADMPENEFEMVSGNGEKLRVKCAESVTTCTPAKDGFCGEEEEEEEECCNSCKFWNRKGKLLCRVDAGGPYNKPFHEWCGQWKVKR
jgi:hypothetical protein